MWEWVLRTSYLVFNIGWRLVGRITHMKFYPPEKEPPVSIGVGPRDGLNNTEN
jgi:hypothetical protein